jgi:hypothetical protein
LFATKELNRKYDKTVAKNATRVFPDDAVFTSRAILKCAGDTNVGPHSSL